MSTHFLPRVPAFSALNPEPPIFDEPSEFDVIASALSALAKGRLLKRKGAIDMSPGYYLYVTENRENIFIKVVSRDHVARQIDSDNYARWVSRCGVPACCMRTGFPIAVAGNLTIFGYDFLEYRFARTDFSDLSILGRSVANLHLSLAQYPKPELVRNSSNLRMKALLLRIKKVLALEQKGLPKSDLLCDIFRRELVLLKEFGASKSAQILHGDLVIGNVLFPLTGAAPVFLDFEDSSISWAPIDLDIALILERFVLMTPMNQSDVIHLGRAFLGGYSDAVQRKNFLLFPLEKCLIFLAVRALATLAELTAKGEEVLPSEWKKFFSLYNNARSKSSLLKQIEDGFFVK